MKKIFLTVLSFVWLNILLAQEKPYLVQMHFMEVKGDINAFIEDNSKFFKPMAKLAVKDGKWAGWGMAQSRYRYDKFVFFHHFNSPEQYEKFNFEIFNQENAKRLGLKIPDGSKYEWSGHMELYQIVASAFGGEDSEYFLMNEYSTSNVVNFTKNNQLWGQLYVTPMLENNPKMNFAAGIKIDGEIVNSAINFNAISFDGFSSLTDLINAQAYEDEKWNMSNVALQPYLKEVEKMNLSDFADEKRSTIWRNLDDSWD